MTPSLACGLPASVGESGRTLRAKAAPSLQHVLFVTGKLAEPALRRVLAEMAPPFACDVAVLKITVAALMTTPWIARVLEVPPGTDLVLIPGLCEGDPQLDRGHSRACAWRRGRRTCARFRGTSARAPTRARLRRVGHRDRRRDQQRAALDARRHPAGGRALPRLRRRHHRHRLHARTAVPRPRRRGARAARARACASASTPSTPAKSRTAVAAGAELVLSVNGSNIDDRAGPRRQRRAVRRRARTRRRPRYAGADHRQAHGVGRAVSDRPDPRADRHGVHGVARALCRGAAPLARCRDADGHRQPDRADRRRFHRRERAADRHLSGARHPRRADHRSHSVGARGGARDRRGAAPDALRRHQAHDPQGRGRSAGDGQGSRGAHLHGAGAARAAGRDHRSELPHLRRSRSDHRAQQRALRARHGHSGDLRAARRRRAGARVLSWEGAGAGEPRGHARQDLPSGGRAVLGLSDAAG